MQYPFIKQRQCVQIPDADAFIDLVDGGVDRAQFDDGGAGRGDEASVRGAASGREFGGLSRCFHDGLLYCGGELAGLSQERFAGQVPIQRVGDVELLEKGLDLLAEAFMAPLR